jgi:hypothetical protein
VRRAALLLALLGAGCSSGAADPQLSSDFATGELRLYPRLSSNGGAILATATLADGAGSWVALRGDRLLLRDGAAETEFSGYDGGYAALLETESTEPAVVLAREEGGEVSVTVPLPPAFALTPPPDPSPLAEPFTFTWDAYDGAPSISVTSPCFSPVTRALSLDVGAYTIQPADLAYQSDLAQCEVTVVITRASSPSIPAPELAAEVAASAQQIRTVRFTGTR